MNTTLSIAITTQNISSGESITTRLIFYKHNDAVFAEQQRKANRLYSTNSRMEKNTQQ